MRSSRSRLPPPRARFRSPPRCGSTRLVRPALRRRREPRDEISILVCCLCDGARFHPSRHGHERRPRSAWRRARRPPGGAGRRILERGPSRQRRLLVAVGNPPPCPPGRPPRSEEHTSELQSHSDLVCRLLLEKKKNKTK